MDRTRKRDVPYLPLILALGTAGCDVDPASRTIQRDVYTRMEECVADWGNADLCKSFETQTAHATPDGSTPANQQRAAGGGFVYIHGPGYYGSERAVSYNGQTIRPAGTHTPVAVNSFDRGGSFVRSNAAPKGGFGPTGARAGAVTTGSS